MPCEPCQLKPGNSGDSELVRFAECPGGSAAQPVWLSGPPLNDVGVEHNGGHSRLHAAPVVNSASSSAMLNATPVNAPFSACGPVAGISRATVRPCLVISTSSPAATSS